MSARPWLPVRPICIALAGLVCTGQALWSLAHPAQLASVNRAGWLYQQFGPAGVGVGLLVLGLALLAGGVAWTWRSWRRWRGP